MTHHFTIIPTQEELDARERAADAEDRRRMGALVWVIVAGPVCWVAIYLGLKWMWGV